MGIAAESYLSVSVWKKKLLDYYRISIEHHWIRPKSELEKASTYYVETRHSQQGQVGHISRIVTKRLKFFRLIFPRYVCTIFLSFSTLCTDIVHHAFNCTFSFHYQPYPFIGYKMVNEEVPYMVLILSILIRLCFKLWFTI